MAAETPTLEQLAAEEQELQFERFDHDTAWALGNALVDAAREQGLPLALDIRRNGQQLFHCALEGTAADNDAWILRKARVVDRCGHSSLYIGERARAAGTTFEEQLRLDPDVYAAHGGGFPVTVRGVGVVGTVVASGLPQLEDHAFVVGVLRAFLAAPRLSGMLATTDLHDARESLAYWEDRSRRLPRYAFRARREAREMARRWRARVVAAERADYGAGLLGALFLVLTERRLPEAARHTGRKVVRRGMQAAGRRRRDVRGARVLAVVAVVDLVSSLV